ncbi:hypothetical protein PC121_g20619 [Phytophthora cactorum]|nr:hypothetical protein PC120_g21261 [Phytophthora cactorum]KAG3046509.1 hypothetical protein PC121_g20619 [Phytophthora cactorum]KAG4037910.1 hypothetical protein PC123_g26527 [Phytophthora cactorum]
MSRPFPTEVPEGVESQPNTEIEGPLTEAVLSFTSYVERFDTGGEETAFSGVGNAAVDVLVKRIARGEEQYLVLTPTYEV